MIKFASTKTYEHNVGLSCCFRQWRATSHCKYLHGYALKVKFIFGGERDENNWVYDFGGLKPIKKWLEDTFDHKMLVAKDDPELELFKDFYGKGIAQVFIVDSTGCEAFAHMIFLYARAWVERTTDNRVKLLSVEVSEHAGNSGIAYVREG